MNQEKYINEIKKLREALLDIKRILIDKDMDFEREWTLEGFNPENDSAWMFLGYLKKDIDPIIEKALDR